MKKVVLTLTMLFMLAASQSMAAKKSNNEINFGSLTCKDFMAIAQTSNDDEIASIMLWLDGYLSGVSGDMILNWKSFEDFAGNLVNFCSTNGRVKVVDAAKKVGIE